MARTGRSRRFCVRPVPVLWTIFFVELLYVYVTIQPVKQTLDSCEYIFVKPDLERYKKYADQWRRDVDRSRELLTLTQINEPTNDSALCPGLWIGDDRSVVLAANDEYNSKERVKLKDLSEYMSEADNCTSYVLNRGYRYATVTEEELNFPLAFSLLVYKDVDQVERLLRAIYRPHNVYCVQPLLIFFRRRDVATLRKKVERLLRAIYRPHNVYCVHVDSKADATFRLTVELIVRCLPNVFIAEPSIDVQWGYFSVLQPELVCMRMLWEHPTRWRYFINLTGQEFPLKTNRELVQILTAFRGANDITGTENPYYVYRWMMQLPTPQNLRVTTGDVHIVASREYVDYVLHSRLAKQFLHWVCLTIIPDETYFSTLNHNPQLGVPGSSTANPSWWISSRSTFARHKIWIYKRPDLCSGRWVRGICHFGVGDVPLLTNSTQMFANKFSYGYQPLAYDCIEAWYWFKVKREKEGTAMPLNVSFYEHSDVVRYRYTGPVLVR